MTASGIPMIFQGQEMNEDWTFSSSTALRWSLTNTWSGMVRAYTDLVHARRNLRGGTQGLKGTGVNVHHKDDLNKVISYVRWDAGRRGGRRGGGGELRGHHVDQRKLPGGVSVRGHLVFALTTATARTMRGLRQHRRGAGGGVRLAAQGGGEHGHVQSADFFQNRAAPGRAVDVEPAQPNGCVPVMLTYVPGRRSAGRARPRWWPGRENDWHFRPMLNLTNNGSGVWSGVHPIPFGAEVLDVSFHNGAESNRVWDNNLGNDWHFR
jgi:hypothetical protein